MSLSTSEYPYVFEWQGEYYMIPETHQTESVRRYHATLISYRDLARMITTAGGHRSR